VRASDLQRYEETVWRIVEAQHRTSTLKLVDTAEEQRILEELIETAKPNVPDGAKSSHFLLSTPFRYAPYPHGSRFRRAGWTPGVFYASEHIETAIAEMAFYRYLFFAASPDAEWPQNATEYTAFSVVVAADKALDLTAPPYSGQEAKWTHLTDYAACQAIADQAREVDCAVIRYRSVRDKARRANVAVLSLEAFAAKRPSSHQSWRIRIGKVGASALCEAPKWCIDLPLLDFLTDQRLANLVKP
jgi:RES domain